MNDGPFEVVVRGFVVGVVDVVGDAGFVEAFADVFGEGLPGGVGLFVAGKQEFNLDAELEGTLTVHFRGCSRGSMEWSKKQFQVGRLMRGTNWYGMNRELDVLKVLEVFKP